MLKNNELDLDKAYDAYWQTKFAICKKSFENANIPFHIVSNEQEIKEYIKNFISERSQIKEISFSDGVTLYQLGLFEWINKKFPPK